MTDKSRISSAAKKLLSAICAVCLVLTFSIPTFAETASQVQVDSYSSHNNVAGGLSFIERAGDLDSLNAVFERKVYPSAMVFTVDDALNVKTKSGEDLGYTLSDGLNAIISYARPVIEIADEATADAVCALLSEAEYHDFFILSDSAELLRYAHSVYDWSCGILDRTALTSVPDTPDLAKICADACSSYSSVVLFSPEAVSQDSIRYLFARSVLSWTEDTRDLTDTEALREVLSGTFGVISHETDRLYRCATEMIEPNTLTRVPVNIAHRGSPFHAPENTVESIQKAMEEGADGVEIDIFYTVDNQIILNHDGDTNYTCGVDYVVYQHTLEELQALNANCGMDEEYPYVQMPTLETVIKLLAQTDLIAYIEIKDSYNEGIVRDACAIVEKYGYTDRTVFISFYHEQLVRVKKYLPEVPVSYLIGFVPESGDPSWDTEEMMAQTRPMGMTIDSCFSQSNTPELCVECYARGFDDMLWTFSLTSEMADFFACGYVNMTNNIPYDFINFAIGANAGLDADTYRTGLTYKAAGEPFTYDGSEMKASRRSLIVPDDEGAVLSDKDSAVTFTTPGEHTFFEGFTFRGNTSYTVYGERTVTVEDSRGDANNDGSADAKDVSAILGYITGHPTEVNTVAADMDKNGTVALKDAAIMLKELAGYTSAE